MDYSETSAPVVKFNSIRALPALVVHHDLEVHQMDVVTVLLRRDADEKIFMEILEGVETDVGNRKDYEEYV